jgi:F0F1-type ATP synthase membrane subunit c/vacuolar-type H+-ATPase subunit K
MRGAGRIAACAAGAAINAAARQKLVKRICATGVLQLAMREAIGIA